VASKEQIQVLIVSTAQSYGVDPNLALAVAQRESNFNQAARGTRGEIGVFQLKPATAADLGVNPYDLVQNIQGGVRYLRQMLNLFGQDVSKALAAYNAGPGRVGSAVDSALNWFAAIPATTQQYVAKILAALGWGTTPPSPAPVVAPPTLPPGGQYILLPTPSEAASSPLPLLAVLGASAAALYWYLSD
jgi:soluble lytic murein transglycosylase-like protein